MEDAPASVRVDFDGDEAEWSAVSPDSPGGDRDAAASIGFRSAMLFAALSLVVIGVLVWLQPEDGQTADGTLRRTVTSSTSATTIAQVSYAPLSVISAAGGRDVSEVVAAESGFLGLVRDGTSPGISRLAPTIWRSVDGRSWTRLETSVVGEPPRGVGSVASYTGLVRTADGFSVFRIVNDPVFDGSRGINGQLERLASERGDVWTIEQTFPALNANVSFPLMLDEDHSAIITFDGGSPDLVALLDQHVRAAVDVVPCLAERFGADLRIFGCEDGVVIGITPDDVVDPALAAEVFACAAALSDSGSGTPDLSLRLHSISSGETVEVELDRQLSSPPVVLDDGSMMAVAAADLRELPVSCAELGLPMRAQRNAALLVWDAFDAAPRAIPVPNHIAAQSPVFGYFQAFPRSYGDGMLVMGAGSLWRVRTDGAWTELAELGAVPGEANGFLTPEGDVAINVNGRENTLTRWDIDAGSIVATETFELGDAVLGRASSQVLFAGPTEVFLQMWPGLRVIDLDTID